MHIIVQSSTCSFKQTVVHFIMVSWNRLPVSGSVSSSASVSQMTSGISLVSFNSRGLEGMHQRSYSVSSADQWTDATVIANSGVSTGTKKPNFFFFCCSLLPSCFLCDVKIENIIIVNQSNSIVVLFRSH